MMHHIKKCTSHPGFGMFLIRFVVGIIFINHGIAKLSDIAATSQFFDMMLPVSLGTATIVAWAIALIETIGGIAMVLGAFTRVAGWLLIAVMAGAIIFVKSKMPFTAGEIDLLLLASLFAITVGGPGKYALGAYCSKCRGMKCGCSKDMCDGCDTCKDGCTGHEVTRN